MGPQTQTRYIVETACLLAFTYGFAFTGVELDTVLSIVGAIGYAGAAPRARPRREHGAAVYHG